MIRVTIYGKKGCCLCEEAKEVIHKVAPDYPCHITEVDITTDPDSLKRYEKDIPLVTIQGQRAFRYKVHEATLRKKLELIVNHPRERIRASS